MLCEFQVVIMLIDNKQLQKIFFSESRMKYFYMTIIEHKHQVANSIIKAIASL